MKGVTLDECLAVNIKTPSGQLVNEVEIMRFFVMYSKLSLIKHETVFAAFCNFTDKLERTKQKLKYATDSAQSTNSTTDLT